MFDLLNEGLKLQIEAFLQTKYQNKTTEIITPVQQRAKVQKGITILRHPVQQIFNFILCPVVTHSCY